MLAAERQNRIREILLEYMHVDVSSLCTLLRVSPATVRRDLDSLEKEGFLLKTYGGAVLSESKDGGRVQLRDIDNPFESERKSIAAYAATLVEDDDTVFLGGDDTCLMLARQLALKKRLSVVTNSIGAAMALMESPGISKLLIGGVLSGDPANPEACGEAARAQVSNMFFNKCFFSLDGVSLQRGYTVNNLEKCSLLRTVLANSTQSYALVDSSSAQKTSLHPLGKPDLFANVVAPMSIPAEFQEFWLNNGIRLYEVTPN